MSLSQPPADGTDPAGRRPGGHDPQGRTGLSAPFRPAFSGPGDGGLAATGPAAMADGLTARAAGAWPDDWADDGPLHGDPPDEDADGGGGARGRGVSALVLGIGLGIGILLVAAIVLLQDVAITLPLLIAVLAAVLLGPMLAALLTLRLVRALERGPAGAMAGTAAASARDAARLAAAAAPLALAVTDADGRLLFANRRMRAALPAGLAPAGCSLPDLLEPEDGDGDAMSPGAGPRRMRLPDGRAVLLQQRRLPHPAGRLLWQL
ncbi:hypothetical protein ACFOGJ_09145, partial [Marinibaculum pumilum]